MQGFLRGARGGGVSDGNSLDVVCSGTEGRSGRLVGVAGLWIETAGMGEGPGLLRYLLQREG